MAKPNVSPMLQDEQEMKQVRHDLVRVIILNVVFFAALIALYVMNKQSGAVDHFFGKFLNF